MADAPSGKTEFWRGRLRSLGHAWRGIGTLIRTQTNARIHLAATVIVVVLGFLKSVTAGEWTALALAIGLVWVAEGLNTAVELLADRITTERDERIGRAKDIAAGAVLVSSIAAAIVGLVVFLR